ncbi:hypothetical protein EPJ64_00555 [Brachyspira aalborgi]|uniref:Lipocalin-like domain-containing protein n=2 Tax=Brachyspira aalborgi TaxID=29522 RepID=A0ABY3KBN5_9SPIR|nr:hypothetical protein [Brachyspira aalborgi]MBS4764392.1 hypothetical protein [Brachyspira sp.]TXJ16572.1 hypothetical protein EPJ77_02290 [Brachyspira aalborgi]TXJ22678.1 hypothetical protein EPJ64_00555 [Brachyspira aalborgi]TXJ34305.1 hypothetical protein EPJ71_00090 [Brachyspira aalborgi]TXJ42997.1 hypothetical protein EPJ65_04605 [Brachyspira aalborgi]
MKNSKNKKLFTYLVVGALVIALSISCKNDETDPNAGKFKHSDLVGTWTGDAGSFTINSSGYVNFTYQNKTYNDNILGYFEGGMESEGYTTSTSSFNSDYNPNANHVNGAERKIANFLFNSSSSCKVTITEQKYSGTYPNGEWQTQNTISVGNFTK